MGKNQVNSQARTAGGRFSIEGAADNVVHGSSKNPVGRPRYGVAHRYLKSLQNTVSEEEWVQISRKAVEQAKEGDRYARKWLSDYLLGPPPTEKDVQPPMVDARSVTLDASKLTGDQLRSAIELAKAINTRSGVDEEGGPGES